MSTRNRASTRGTEGNSFDPDRSGYIARETIVDALRSAEDPKASP